MEHTRRKRKARCDTLVHQFVKRATESMQFNVLIMVTIFLNALFIALETMESVKAAWGIRIFEILDYVFLAIYILEFILKTYAEPKNYWKSGYNLFDFFILVISLAAVFFPDQGDNSNLESLKVLRALRTLRTLRTVSFIRGLQVLVTALVDTIRQWVINILGLLLLTMFLFAIMGYYFFGYDDSQDRENWGALDRALLTLVSFVTVDGWTKKQEELDKVNLYGSRAYTALFILVGHFIFTNVFVGVIIVNISEATEAYKNEQQTEREAVLKHKKEFMMKRQHQDVKQLLERQKKGQYSNFQEMVREFEKSLRHNDSVMMSDLCTNVLWLETYIRSLDHMDETMYKLQQLHFEMANTMAHAMEMRLKKKYGFL